MNYNADMTKSQIEAGKWLECSELNTGDKVLLTNGDQAEFVRLKQKKFIGIINDKSYNIPVTMFVKVLDKGQSKAETEEYKTLKPGELFYINKNGDAKLFIFKEMKNGRIIGINPISKGQTRIDTSLYHGKVSDIKLS